MEKLVSIIIPVYKVEKYIQKCMQSLLDQTYRNFEALVVDDGSPDNSITLAKELIGNDSRFIFLEKENGGQGSARNLGLDNAKGDYIAFLDSDDSYTPDMLQIVVDEFSKESDIDVLTFGINFVNNNNEILFNRFSRYSYFDTSQDILLLNKTTTNYFWDKAYKSSALVTHRFSSDIKTYEDTDLMYQVLYSRKIKSIPNCLYNYTQRSGSTTRSLPPTFIDDKKRVVENAEKFLKENNIFEYYKQYYAKYYLIEMYYKPILTISHYSKMFKEDINLLLSNSKKELLTLDNIYPLKNIIGTKALVILLSLKANKYLPFTIIQLNILIKKIKLL